MHTFASYSSRLPEKRIPVCSRLEVYFEQRSAQKSRARQEMANQPFAILRSLNEVIGIDYESFDRKHVRAAADRGFSNDCAR